MDAKENLLRVIRHDHPAWVPNGLEAVVTLYPPIDERPRGEGADPFGVHWAFVPEAEGGTFPSHGGRTVTDLGAWREQVAIPDIHSLDWSGVEAQARTVDREHYLVQGFVHMGLFERSYLLLGMEEALVAYLTRPEEMRQLLAALATFKIDLIKRFHEVAHLDMLHFGDDWCIQDRLFVAPEIWRQTIKPEMARLYGYLKQQGIIINQHSCGRIEEILADLIEMGVDMWNPCQPCNDLARLKRAYGGKITFFGGIDSQFVLARPGVTVDEVRAEVRRRIDEMAAGGGYIAAPSQGLPYDSTVVAAMNDEINRYGYHYYQ